MRLVIRYVAYESVKGNLYSAQGSLTLLSLWTKSNVVMMIIKMNTLWQ